MKEKLYPVYYKGKFWNEEDVDDVFRAYYHTRYALDFNVSVYVENDSRIMPDGEWL